MISTFGNNVASHKQDCCDEAIRHCNEKFREAFPEVTCMSGTELEQKILANYSENLQKKIYIKFKIVLLEYFIPLQ
jgi:hypothetical protein